MQHAISEERISAADFRNDQPNGTATPAGERLSLKVRLVADLVDYISYPDRKIRIDSGDVVDYARDSRVRNLGATRYFPYIRRITRAAGETESLDRNLAVCYPAIVVQASGALSEAGSNAIRSKHLFRYHVDFALAGRGVAATTHLFNLLWRANHGARLFAYRDASGVC
jgi:hypothetical protein